MLWERGKGSDLPFTGSAAVENWLSSRWRFWSAASSWLLHCVPCSSLARPTISNSGPHPSEVVVTQGSDISLECEAQGIPEPAVMWLKDGRALGSGRDVAVLAGGRVLRLQRAQVSDTGRYVCVATNAAGLADRKYDLSVHGEWGHLGTWKSTTGWPSYGVELSAPPGSVAGDAALIAVLGKAQIEVCSSWILKNCSPLFVNINLP